MAPIAKAMHPDIKKIKSSRIILLAGLVALVTQLFAFVFFLSTSYISKVNSEFLSIDSTAGICESVTLSKTDVYYVDKYGSWDQAATFKPQESLFVVDFMAYRGDDASWAADMDALYSAINTEMDYLRSISDLPTKILHLNSWRKTITAAKSGSFRVWFNAGTSYIFDTPNSQLDTIIGKYVDDCESNDAWDLSDGILTLNFDDVWAPTANAADDTGVIKYPCATFSIEDVGFNPYVSLITDFSQSHHEVRILSSDN